ncbi:AMP-binding protein [Actinosynnema sp. NPDC050436]|uniref:AMP-binding protein n=1 Tax=Actinosynnema sp. NPDC050436 TaxID=3155659 RepID=UPI0033F9BCD3
MHRIPSSKGELRSLVASVVGELPHDVDEHENLIEYGIDSLGMMRIIGSWHAQGLAVKFCELSERPTLAQWWELVGGRAVSGPVEVPWPQVDPSAPFALDPVQRAYWAGRADGQVLGGVGCHVYLEVDGSGVDAESLRRAVLAVVRRHPMLRARFLADGTQQVLPEPAWTGLTHHDLRALDEDGVRRELDRVRSELSHRRLAVERGEVFDVRLSSLPGGRTRLHVELDSLVADVLSLGVFLHDLAACYAGGAESLPPLTYTFPQYRADLERSRGPVRERDREYWMSRIADLPPAPRLPLACDPAQIGKPVFRRLAHWVDPDRYRRLVALARRHRVTPAMVLATAFAEVLGRWSGQTRVLLDLPVFDRVALHDDVPRVIGAFTNHVLLDVDLSGESFADRVRAVQRRFQADASHGACSAAEVLREVLGHDGPAAPVLFTGDMGGGELLGDRFRESFGELGHAISQTPGAWLDHRLVELDGGLYLTWDHVAGLFETGVVEGMFEVYRDLLEWLLGGDWSVAPPVGLPQSQRVVRAVVAETAGLESGRLLHEGFYEWAEAEPDRVAVVSGDGAELSFGALADRSLRIAGALAGRGVRPGDAVVVAVPGGPDLVAAALGVLAAGGVYVPVAVDAPPDHRRRAVEIASAAFAVSESGCGPWPANVRVVPATACGHAPLPRPVGVRATDPAYVLLTGPEGRPGGVEVSHRSVVNTLEDVTERFGVGAGDRVLAVSPVGSDLAVFDLFGLLGSGGAVVLPDDGGRADPGRWAELCERHGVTVWNSTPERFAGYLSAARGSGDRLRLALVSGGRVGSDLPARFRARCPQGRFVALGGAAGAAIWSSAFEVDGVPDGRPVPWGFALRNQRYRVVDPAGRDCPDRVPGELWIGGLGVAEGYRGDPVRSSAAFVWWEGRRWYRTGDLGRFRHDGALEPLDVEELSGNARRR